MKTIALVGPYNPKQHESLYRNVPEGYRMFDVPSPQQYALLKDVDYIIIRTIRLHGDDLKHCPNLKLVQKWGAGYDNIDVPSVSERKIPVAICLGINSQPVAEMAVLHMLALYRNFLVLNSTLRRQEWAKDMYSSRAYILRDKTIGIIGLGNIGRKVVRIVQGFGATVQYYDTRHFTPELEQELGVAFVPFEQLLKTSDIVTIHVPRKEDTYDMIGEKQLEMMKPSALLINTSRGGIVDEEALARALQSGVIAGAGLDVFADEPPAKHNPLFDLENVTITPHTGGNTADNDINMIRRCMENIRKIERGEDLGEKDVVNRHLL